MSELQLGQLRVHSSDQIVSSSHVGTELFVDEFLHLDAPSSQIFFYIAKKDVLLAKLEEDERVKCPCLWAEAVVADTEPVVLHVAYDLGFGIHFEQLESIDAEVEIVDSHYPTSSPIFTCCVQRKVYLQLYKLVHILFPTMEHWRQEMKNCPYVTTEKKKAADMGLVHVASKEMGIAMAWSPDVESSLTIVPNFIIGCLEARQDNVEENYICLRTVRRLEEAISIIKGEIGCMNDDLTPKGDAPYVFQSPVKSPLGSTNNMTIEIAVSKIGSFRSGDLRDGASYLQNVSNDPYAATLAIQHRAFQALVGAASSMLSSFSIGPIEQLSIVSLTASMLLDGCAEHQRREASATLVSDFSQALSEPCANPTLLLQFMLAMLHRPDIKAAAIKEKIYNVIAELYMRRLPLLEPLANALLSPLASRCPDFASSESLEMETADDEIFRNLSISESPTRTDVPPLFLRVIPFLEEERISTQKGGLTRATRREGRSRQRLRDRAANAAGFACKTCNHESAEYQMRYSAEALGESLVAQDLPAITSHRRSVMDISIFLNTRDTDSVADEKLGLTLPSSDIKAHKLDNSSGDSEVYNIDNGYNGSILTHSSRSTNEESEYVVSETEKCFSIRALLIDSLLASYHPVSGFSDIDPDPSLIVTADVLSFPTFAYEGCPYVHACIKLLSRISRSKKDSDHVFLVALGNKLASLSRSCHIFEEKTASAIAYLIGLGAEYLSMSSLESNSSLVASSSCLPPLRFMLKHLSKEIKRTSDLVLIDEAQLALLQGILKFLTRCLQLSRDQISGRSYVATLLGDLTVAEMLVILSQRTLLSTGEQEMRIKAVSKFAEIEKDLLSLFVELVQLVNRLPSTKSGSKSGISDAIIDTDCTQNLKSMSKTESLNWMLFLVSPGSPLIQNTLECEIVPSNTKSFKQQSLQVSLNSRSVRLRNGVFNLLQALFAAKDGPFIEDRDLTDYYVRFHFIRFLKLYHNPGRDHQSLFLCKQHLQMLCTLATAARGSQSSSASYRFQQLSVVDFFVKEMALEFESNHGRQLMRSESSADSAMARDQSGEFLSGIPRHLRPAKSLHSAASTNLENFVDKEDNLDSTKSMVPSLVLPSPDINSASSCAGPLGSGNFDSLMSKTTGISIFSFKDKGLGKIGVSVAGTAPTCKPKVLETVKSATTYLDSDVIGSSSTKEKESSLLSDYNDDRELLVVEPVALPKGFVFSGDLDEDVDRLEALDSASDSDDSFFSSSTTEDSDSAEEMPLSGPKETIHADLKKDFGVTAGNSVIPKLNISSSMRSCLHKRAKSAELLQAFEQENGIPLGESGTLDTPSSNSRLMSVQFTSSLQGRQDGNNMFFERTASHKISNIDLERSKRLLYCDDDLHVLAIKLIFMLIIDTNGDLHSAYCDMYPWDRKMQNIPLILQQHLNASPTKELLGKISSALYGVGKHALRFLHIMCADYFRPEWYTARTRISGVNSAFSTVHRCATPSWAEGQNLVLKVVDAPKHNNDRCSFVEFYSETSIHDCLRHHPKACQMVDYGLDISSDAMVLVLKEYKCSLKQWRTQQKQSIETRILIYWMIFREIICGCIDLLASGVVHFDLKCDNVLLEPLEGVSEDAFWHGAVKGKHQMDLTSLHKWPTLLNNNLAFRVVLGDFGESIIFHDGVDKSHCLTSQARGTDAFKSPEMLLIGGAPQVHHRAFDRRRSQGAGSPSDVWSLGCLLFELMTGNMLFTDNDWLQLVARITSPESQLITQERQELIDNLPGVSEMLSFLLIRDPNMRPSLDDALFKLDSILAEKDFCVNLESGTPNLEQGSEGMRIQNKQLSSNSFHDHIIAQCPSGFTAINCIIHVSDNLIVAPVDLVRQIEDMPNSSGDDVFILSHVCSSYDIKSNSAVIPEIDEVLRNECLMEHVEEINSGPHSCSLLCSPSMDASDRVLKSWITEVINRHIAKPQSEHEVSLKPTRTIIASHGMDDAAVFLAIAIEILRTKSMYRAMVHASKCRIDAYLTERIICLLNTFADEAV